jgi:hypothetical protein
MNPKELHRRLRGIADEKGAVMTMRQGGNHTKVYFDGKLVTVVPYRGSFKGRSRHHETLLHQARS